MNLYRTQGAEGSQPAMKTRRNEDMSKMHKIKDVNIHVNVMYNMCACMHVHDDEPDESDTEETESWNPSGTTSPEVYSSPDDD
jgi:hypothetical protein